MFPPIAIIGPLFNMWRSLGLFDTWPGLIIPYMTFTLPLAIYTLSAFFREIPWDLEQGGPDRRRHAVPGLPPGDRPAGHAGHVHHGDPRLHLRLERLPVRHLADLDRPGPHRAGGDDLLHRRRRSSTYPTGPIAAASVVITIPIIIIVLIFQRRIVAGLTSGAVKG